MGDGNDILLVTFLPNFLSTGVQQLLPRSLFLSSVDLLQMNPELIPSGNFLEGSALVFNIESWLWYAGPILTVTG